MDMQIANDRWSGEPVATEPGAAEEQAPLNRMCSLYYESSLCEDVAANEPVLVPLSSCPALSEPEEDTCYE